MTTITLPEVDLFSDCVSDLTPEPASPPTEPVITSSACEPQPEQAPPPAPVIASESFRQKMTVLCRPYYATQTHLFYEWSEDQIIKYFLDLLSPQDRYTVDFAMTPDAIKLILNYEMGLEGDGFHQQVVFNKPCLDELSWVAANGLPSLNLTLNEQDELNRMMVCIKRQLDDWSMVIPYGAQHIDEVTVVDLKAFLALFAKGFSNAPLETLNLLTQERGIWRLFNLMMVHVMNKKDAIGAIFGQQSIYYRLWQLKQTDLFRLMKQFHKAAQGSTGAAPQMRRIVLKKDGRPLPVAMNY